MAGVTDDRNVPHAQGPPDETPVPQAETYLVLSEAERARGFVRPVRRSYQHRSCGTVTTMGQALAETYAVNPGFYGSTYCCGCSMHRAVDEFVWLNVTGEITSEPVGS